MSVTKLFYKSVEIKVHLKTVLIDQNNLEVDEKTVVMERILVHRQAKKFCPVDSQLIFLSRCVEEDSFVSICKFILAFPSIHVSSL